MRANAISDIGKVRKTNEDSFLCVPPHLFIVADGMGGHVAGEIASHLGATTVAEYVKEQDLAILPPTQPIEFLLQRSIEKANEVIFTKALESPEFTGMGTTLTVAYVAGEQIFWGHLGDSRLYLFRDGQLRQITHDHSLVGELVRNGALTPEEAKVHPRRNILTRAAGVGKQAEVDCGQLEWRSGDRLLLCTDGLTGLLSDQELAAILCIHAADGEKAVNALIDGANQAGGTDNITAVLLDHQS